MFVQIDWYRFLTVIGIFLLCLGLYWFICLVLERIDVLEQDIEDLWADIKKRFSL